MAFISGSGGRAAGAAPPLRSVRTAPARRCPQPQHHQASPGQRSGGRLQLPQPPAAGGGLRPSARGARLLPPPPPASSRPPLAASAAGRAGAGPCGDGRVVAVRGAALRALLRVARPHHAAHRPAAAAARRRPLPAQRESGPGVLGVCVCRGGGHWELLGPVIWCCWDWEPVTGAAGLLSPGTGGCRALVSQRPAENTGELSLPRGSRQGRQPR